MASIRLYNTLTKHKDELKPIAATVTLYTCGPTVYGSPHIGNWRTFVFYDTLKRTLIASGHNVNHVLNITDVGHLTSDEDEGEDKLVTAAKSERKTAWDIAERYTAEFVDGLKQLNILPPTHMPKATDCIDEQIAMVQKLVDKGYTYTIDDGVYFDTAKLEDYGKLAGLKPDQLDAKARVEPNPQKHRPTDFALWKFSPANETRDMEWDSPWGKGFPGWHLECSVMAQQYLGDTIDIHAGGIDHIPVHHTNEIAQSETATGQPFAHIWVHSEFLKINDAKIAKSAGNGITLGDIKARGFDLRSLRLLLVQSHYKTAANFSWSNLEAARNRLLALQAMADRRFQYVDRDSEDEGELLARTRHDILASAQDDLNTPKILEHIAEIERFTGSGVTRASQSLFEDLLELIDSLLGLELLSSKDAEEDIYQQITERQQARESGDFARSDQLRAALSKKGIELDDTPAQTFWRRNQL